MNTLRSLLFRTLVPVSFATICVYLTYAKEGPALVPIAQNLAWNDFITQIKFLTLVTESQPFTRSLSKPRSCRILR